MNIEWFDGIINEELWSITQQKAIENQIKRGKWNWIGHKLRKEAGVIEKTALEWNHQGYGRRSRPRRTWRRTIEDEIRGTRRSWTEVKGIAGDRINWKLWMPYAPQGVKGPDDDDEVSLDINLVTCILDNVIIVPSSQLKDELVNLSALLYVASSKMACQLIHSAGFRFKWTPVVLEIIAKYSVRADD
jgi:hypothetical protein